MEGNQTKKRSWFTKLFGSKTQPLKVENTELPTTNQPIGLGYTKLNDSKKKSPTVVNTESPTKSQPIGDAKLNDSKKKPPTVVNTELPTTNQPIGDAKLNDSKKKPPTVVNTELPTTNQPIGLGYTKFVGSKRKLFPVEKSRKLPTTWRRRFLGNASVNLGSRLTTKSPSPIINKNTRQSPSSIIMKENTPSTSPSPTTINENRCKPKLLGSSITTDTPISAETFYDYLEACKNNQPGLIDIFRSSNNLENYQNALQRLGYTITQPIFTIDELKKIISERYQDKLIDNFFSPIFGGNLGIPFSLQVIIINSINSLYNIISDREQPIKGLTFPSSKTINLNDYQQKLFPHLVETLTNTKYISNFDFMILKNKKIGKEYLKQVDKFFDIFLSLEHTKTEDEENTVLLQLHNQMNFYLNLGNVLSYMALKMNEFKNGRDMATFEFPEKQFLKTEIDNFLRNKDLLRNIEEPPRYDSQVVTELLSTYKEFVDEYIRIDNDFKEKINSAVTYPMFDDLSNYQPKAQLYLRSNKKTNAKQIGRAHV